MSRSNVTGMFLSSSLQTSTPSIRTSNQRRARTTICYNNVYTCTMIDVLLEFNMTLTNILFYSPYRGNNEWTLIGVPAVLNRALYDCCPNAFDTIIFTIQVWVYYILVTCMHASLLIWLHELFSNKLVCGFCVCIFKLWNQNNFSRCLDEARILW